MNNIFLKKKKKINSICPSGKNNQVDLTSVSPLINCDEITNLRMNYTNS